MTQPSQLPANHTDRGLKCSHPGCRCPTRAGEKYCNDICEHMVGVDICPCGHPECKNHYGNKP